MSDDLDALQAVAEAATPGRWYQNSGLIWGDDNAIVLSVRGLTYVNAEHIAAFDPPTVLALIGRVRDAEAKPGACDASMMKQIREQQEMLSGLRSRLAAAEAQAESFLTAATEYPATVIEVGTEMVRLTDGILSFIAMCAKSNLREPIGGHPVVTVDYVAGLLTALLGDTSTPTDDES